MSHGNQANNSSSTLSGFAAPKMSWRYSDNPAIVRDYMGVVLGSDNTIYVGGRSSFVALNPDGTVKWTANEVTLANSWGTPAVGDNSLVYISSPTGVYAYSTGGSGGVTFISSATAGTASLNPGGGGAVKISTFGTVFVGHGDATLILPPGAANYNAYSYNNVLAPRISYIGGADVGWGRSALNLMPDSSRLCYSRPSASLNCVNPWNAASMSITYDGGSGPELTFYGGPGTEIAFRTDNTFVAPVASNQSQCGGHLTSDVHIAAFNVSGGLVWRDCTTNLGSYGTLLKFHPVVSDSANNSYVPLVRVSVGTVVRDKIIKYDNTGAITWTYQLGSNGYYTAPGTLGPPTLAAQTTMYFSYCSGDVPECPNGIGTCTRLAAIKASDSSVLWDVMVSTSACYKGQPVPAPGNRLILHNGKEIIAFENSEATALAFSSAAATTIVSGATGFWYSTVTISATKLGGTATSSGVIVEVGHFAASAGTVSNPSITPGATSFQLTDTAGLTTFVVKHEFPMSILADKLPGIVSTMTFRTPGVADLTSFLSETRVVSVSVSTQTPALTAAAVRFSTMTFTVLGSGGTPIANVPCLSRASPSYPGSNSMTPYPSQPVWPTNGSGQATIVFGDDLSSLNNDNYAVYAVTHTVACLGAPSQQIVMREHRVATVQISTGQAGVEIDGSGNYARVSTVTVTLLDSLGAVVPGVPVALDLAASPAPITIAPTAVAFTTATNALGQVKFFVSEYLQGVIPASYATMASTFTLRVLSFPDQTVVLREERVATVTVATGTPTMQGSFRIVTATITVRDAAGAPLPQIPVGLASQNFGLITSYTQFGNSLDSIGRRPTNAVGIATFTIRQELLTSVFSSVYGFGQFSGFNSSHTVSVPQRPDQTVGTREIRAASFTVSSSSSSVDSELRYATMTVTVRDAFSNPVPNVPVAVSSYTRAGGPLFERLAMDPSLDQDYAGAVTNASGQASFTLKLGTSLTDYDTFDAFTASVAFVPLGVPTATSFFLIEGNRLDRYVVSVPTFPVSVGVAFVSTITAVNSYNHRLSSYTQSGINLVALFAGTAVQGTGSLGTNITGAFTEGRFQINSQTYNKVEDIDIKATRSPDGKSGTSPSLTIRGPDHFIVTIPTGAQAGVPFSMTVRAVDASSVQVVGYSATIALSALNAGNPLLGGAGVLGVTSVNMPANGTVTIANQTYTKAQAILINAADTGASVVGRSTYSVNVGAGTPALITLLANPQSTIAGVPSVLTATIFDGFSNPVSNSTATFSIATGSGVVSLSLSGGSVVSAVTSTQAVTDSFGQATAFFSSTNSLSAQANVLRASLGSLARDTTVYTSVLITAAGGAVVNFGNPSLRADIAANTYGFGVRVGIQSKSELTSADLAITTAAFAATANTFVSTTVLRISAVRDSSPSVAAGAGSKLVTVSMPYVVTSGSISVGAYGAQSILVPLSVMRVFKLNQVSSVFEQVLDGITSVNSGAGTVTAEVSDPDGIYVLGAPAFTSLATGSSATVTTALAGGTSAQVIVPLGGFAAPATISVTVPGVSSVPALPNKPGLRGLGITISVTAGGLQPVSPVTIKIGYRAIDVAGVNPDHLRLARYDTTTGWVVLDSGADSATRQVVGQTDHFSLFQIVAQAPGVTVADGFVFPNPFRPALGHTNIKLSNLPAAAHIKIFTATGRLLKELDADAAGQVLNWNGTDREGRALASGVYLAVIEGVGGRRTIKFAVQR